MSFKALKGSRVYILKQKKHKRLCVTRWINNSQYETLIKKLTKQIFRHLVLAYYISFESEFENNYYSEGSNQIQNLIRRNYKYMTY
jgi:hypothetical protein